MLKQLLTDSKHTETCKYILTNLPVNYIHTGTSCIPYYLPFRRVLVLYLFKGNSSFDHMLIDGLGLHKINWRDNNVVTCSSKII